MKKKLSLKNEDRGAALLAVLVILVVVSIIAVVITKITLTNIQMKEVEKSTKTNFYSAESVIDELYAGANAVATEQMAAQYENILKNFTAKQNAGTSLQDVFQKGYMDALEGAFSDGAASGSYSIDTLKSCIATAANRDCLITQTADAVYDKDDTGGLFTLKNIKVSYTNARGYETTITTDLVFSTPQMNFDGGDQIKEYMKYSLIADKQIKAGVANVRVDGNVYAGDQGILATGQNAGAVFSGKTILTRGDITAESGAKLTVGDDGTLSSSVWAQNLRTKGKNKPELAVNGNCFVEDDLVMNGSGSVMTLKGKYYGYNFQQNYDVLSPANDAKYSSAVMINGKQCRLDMTGLSYLMIAGRTYLSRASNNGDEASLNNDIALGESLSVRSNQLAYYVPAKYVSGNMFTPTGLAAFEAETGVTNVSSYLDASKQVAAYHYRDVSGVSSISYYLNFASEAKANEYFILYCSAKKAGNIQSYAEKYLTNDAIQISDDQILTLRGDLMSRRNDGDAFTVQSPKVAIDGGDWNRDGVYWELSSGLAVKYKALQLGLTETNAAATAENVRLTKTDDPLFDTLIDRAALENTVSAHGTADLSGNLSYVAVDHLASDHSAVILVRNKVDASGKSAKYVIPDACRKGIIIATGDVEVKHNFTGLILSGDTITFVSGASVDADEMLVSQLFADDLASGTPVFSRLFKDYGSAAVSSHVTGTVDMKTYLNYENWKKE